MTWNREFENKSWPQSLAGCMRSKQTDESLHLPQVYMIYVLLQEMPDHLATHSNLDPNRVTIGEYPVDTWLILVKKALIY